MRISKQSVASDRSELRSGTFTGDVWVRPLMPSTDGTTINDVFFTPGARTFWHRHERGQILHILSGRGLVCSRGESPQCVDVGDTVWVPAGEVHWHGATGMSCMLHTAISLGETTWLEEVADGSTI